MPDNSVNRPVAVVGAGDTLTARTLQKLIPNPVVKLTPCQAAMGGGEARQYRAVIVENFAPVARGTLSPCAAVRWALSQRADLAVVALDSAEGRRFAEAAKLPVYAYSDGRPQADLTAKNVCLRGGRLEFEALTDHDLLRVRLPAEGGASLYDYLAALAGAAAVGVPLERAVRRLAEM